MKNGHYGIWKQLDIDPKLAKLIEVKKKRAEQERQKKLEEEREHVQVMAFENEKARIEALAAVMANWVPPSREQGLGDTSSSELSSVSSMEDIEFDKSFSSAANSIAVAPANVSMMALLNSTHLMNGMFAFSGSQIPAAAPSAPISNVRSHAPSPSPSASRSSSYSPTASTAASSAGKTLRVRSKIRSICMHCGTKASIEWRNGPAPDRNRCQNPQCNKPRDRQNIDRGSSLNEE
jgi:hypothetical protein